MSTTLVEPAIAAEPAITTPANVGHNERAASVVAGSALAVLGLGRGSLPGLLLAGLGGALIHRGASGSCQVYRKLGIDTAAGDADAETQVARRGIHVEQALLINRTTDELYAFWRDFSNLPRFMHHLARVDIIDERRSHWVTTAPRLAGGEISWDAEITRDEPGALIAWRSLPGSAISVVGEIRFARAPGERGSEVHVSLEYVPPAGRLGHWVATLFAQGPRKQMHDDLRDFKCLMETGEIPTTVGQPRGTCGGHGTTQKT